MANYSMTKDQLLQLIENYRDDLDEYINDRQCITDFDDYETIQNHLEFFDSDNGTDLAFIGDFMAEYDVKTYLKDCIDDYDLNILRNNVRYCEFGYDYYKLGGYNEIQNITVGDMKFRLNSVKSKLNELVTAKSRYAN